MYPSSEVVIPAITCVIGLLLLGRHIIGQDRRTRGNSSVQASVCAHGPDRVTTSDHEPAVPRHSGGSVPYGVENPFPLAFCGSGGGTRTHNLRINSPPLCQLSYPGVSRGSLPTGPDWTRLRSCGSGPVSWSAG